MDMNWKWSFTWMLVLLDASSEDIEVIKPLTLILNLTEVRSASPFKSLLVILEDILILPITYLIMCWSNYLITYISYVDIINWD